MTRDEEIKSKANRFSCNSDEFYSFIHGAEWADKTMIDKACQWLEQHKEDYNKYDAWVGEYVDFKKAMEE